MLSMSKVLLLLRPVSSLPSGESCSLWPLPSASPRSLPAPEAGPQSRPARCTEAPFSGRPSPLGGTLPADPVTPRSRGQRGAFCSPAARRGRGAPALIRLITVHMAAARARPPLSHGREESPSVRRQNRGRFSRRPAPLRRPLAAASSLSSPGSLRLSSGAGSRALSLSSVFLRGSLPLCLPLCLSPRRPSGCFSAPCISPTPGFNVSAHLGSTGGRSCLKPSLLSFLGTLSPGPFKCKETKDVLGPSHGSCMVWGELWALSGGRQLQDSEKLRTCPVLDQGRCGAAPTALCEERLLSGPRVLCHQDRAILKQP